MRSLAAVAGHVEQLLLTLGGRLLVFGIGIVVGLLIQRGSAIAHTRVIMLLALVLHFLELGGEDVVMLGLGLRHVMARLDLRLEEFRIVRERVDQRRDAGSLIGLAVIEAVGFSFLNLVLHVRL